MKNYLLMKSKIPTYLKYYLSKTRLSGLVFNKTYIENLSGTSFYLNHSVASTLKINLSASDTTQESTTGKNLFDKTTIIMGDYINANTTIRASSRQNLYLEAGTYTFSTNLNLTNYGVAIDILPNTPPSTTYNSVQSTGYIENSTKTFTVNTAGYFIITLKKGTSQTFTLNEIIQFDYQLELGSTATSFEPYTNGASPNPDYTQEIHTVTGDNTITISNSDGTLEQNYNINLGVKNLWNENVQVFSNQNLFSISKTNNIWTFTATGNGYAFATSKITLPAGTYVFSSVCTNGDIRVLSGETTLNNPFTLSVETEITYRVFKGSATTGDVVTLSNIQLEEDSVAHSYSPYGQEPIELCKIGDYQDLIFKNIPESEYYDSTLEKGKWNKYARIGKVVLDGSENDWIRNPYRPLYQIAINNIMRLPNSNTKGIVLSNNFSAVTPNDIWNTDINGITNINDADLIRIRFQGDTYSTLEDFKTWLQTHNTIVYYVLETPTKTLLPDTLQTQLDNMETNAQTYDKITNISQDNSDNPFILNISYFRKVK